MDPDPSWLEIISVHQDYFWFAALLGWGLALVLWWWHPHRRSAWSWLPWAAGAAILGALLQFAVFNPPFPFLHSRVMPGARPVYVPELVSMGWLADLGTGLLLAAMASGWMWLAVRERLDRRLCRQSAIY